MTVTPHADVLVTGATGALGRALAKRLAGRCTLVGTGRAEPTRPIQGISRFVATDLTGIPWRDVIGEGTTVYHLAAFVHRRVVSASDVVELRRVNVLETAAIARACRESGASLVFASSVAVLRSARRSSDVPSALASMSEYARSKFNAEQEIRAEGQRGLRHAIVRLPLLYGPYGRGNMERMLRAIGRGLYLPIGDRSIPKSCLFFDDAATALELAAATVAIGAPEFVAAPARVPTLGEIHDAAFAAMGRRAPPHVPSSIALAAARAGDFVLRVLSREPTFAAAVSTLTAPASYDGSNLSRATGFRDRVTLEEGLRRTAEWIRNETVR